MIQNKDTKHIAQLAADAKSGRISRREFMSYAIAAGMTASTGSLLWTSEVAAATPKRGGTFRLGAHDGNTSDNHDPGNYTSFVMIQLAHTYRSYLTMISPDNTLGPDVADSWEPNADASEWTFKLNKKASFHSGKKLTADDVIASMNHHRGDKSTSAAKALLSDVTDLIKKDDHTVTFVLAGRQCRSPVRR